MQPLVAKQDISWSYYAEVFLKNGDEFIKFPAGIDSIYSTDSDYKKRFKVDSGTSCRQSAVSSIYASILQIKLYVESANPKAKMVAVPAIEIDGKTIFAKGGLGMSIYAQTAQDAICNPKVTVPLLDYICGNTMVLVDQKNNELIREYRKTQGRAGDFNNEDKNKIVYKGISNFYLTCPVLNSLATGFARIATNMAEQNREYEGAGVDYLNQLQKLVPQEDIINAINNNDFNLARKNWEKIGPFLAEVCPDCGFYPISVVKLPRFNYFIEQGMDYWFKKDLAQSYIDYRTEGGEAHYLIEAFLDTIVQRDMNEVAIRLNKIDFNDIWK